MKRQVIGWVLVLALIPLPAEAKTKSILRFEDKSKPPATQNAPVGDAPAGEPSPVAGENAPAAEGHAPVESAPPGDAGKDAGLLPGTPAEEDARTPAPRPSGRARTEPVAPPPEWPIAAPSPRRDSAGKSVALPVAPSPPLPQRPVPFTYAPVRPGSVSPRGYDPSLAPPGDLRIPPLAPTVTGQPPARPRVLPRLAPYGTALPPDRMEPPAAAPR